MILTLTIALILANCLLAYRERVAARDRERAAEECAEIRREQAEERLRHAEERRELYQRIQAPEVAVAEAHRERRGSYVARKPVGADDDAAYHRNGAGQEVEGG